MAFDYVARLQDGLTLTLNVDMRFSGTYVVSATTASMVLQETKVVLTPKDIWDRAGVTNEDIERYFDDVLGDIEPIAWRIEGNRLILDDAVLIRKRQVKINRRIGKDTRSNNDASRLVNKGNSRWRRTSPENWSARAAYLSK